MKKEPSPASSVDDADEDDIRPEYDLYTLRPAGPRGKYAARLAGRPIATPNGRLYLDRPGAENGRVPVEDTTASDPDLDDDLRPEYDLSQYPEARPRGYYAARASAPRSAAAAAADILRDPSIQPGSTDPAGLYDAALTVFLPAPFLRVLEHLAADLTAHNNTPTTVEQLALDALHEYVSAHAVAE
jgi:hypothetical protein